MQVMDRLPRLSKRELGELQQMREHMDALHDTIQATRIQAAPALIELIKFDAAVLDRLIVKNMAAIERRLIKLGVREPEAASEELGIGDEQGQGEISRQGEEE